MRLDKKIILAQKRRWRIRKKIKGTAKRPRLAVCFTNKHIHVQCIDDSLGQTKAALSTCSKDLRKQGLRPNCAGATAFGKLVGEKINAAGIRACVYDRAGRSYHGRVKAFADAVRQAGVQF